MRRSWEYNRHTCDVGIVCGPGKLTDLRLQPQAFGQCLQVMAVSCSPSHKGPRSGAVKGWKPCQRQHPGAMGWISAGPDIWGLTGNPLKSVLPANGGQRRWKGHRPDLWSSIYRGRGPTQGTASGNGADLGSESYGHRGEGAEAGTGSRLLLWVLEVLSVMHTGQSLLLSPPGFSRAVW